MYLSTFFILCTLFTSYCAHVPLLHMCASRTSEHASTIYRSQSFRCPSDLRIATLLTTPNPVGAVLRCTHPNAICISNRTGSSAETLDMANPENLEILEILVQTDAVRFGVPFCIRPPFSPHTAHVCYRCTCARIAHLNTPALQLTDSHSSVRATSRSRLFG